MLIIISNNFKKILLLLIVTILYSTFVTANSINIISDTGIITLTIKNRPPVIKNLYFSPEIVFEDTTLGCIAIINDEIVDEVSLVYRWYVNDKLIETNANYLTGFEVNDLVRCEITPIDNENVYGETKKVSIIINKKSPLNAITSFVIKNYNISLLTVFNFIF